MEEGKFERKCWGGVKARVVGKCKYCKCFSMAEVMMIDKTDMKPYHPQCKEKFDREQANNSIELKEGKNA